MAKLNSCFLNKEVQDDNVYGKVELVDSKTLVGMEVIKKNSKAVVSNGKVVNFCSPSYGLLPNVDFFGKMERELIDENIGYKRRSFNYDDAKFSVDYILEDESKIITINEQKNAGVDDTIVPMIRLTNSYDGSTSTAGYLGFFRKVCNNGLHMATTQIEFKVKHTKNQMGLFIPNIEDIVKRFIDNEMFSIKDKIDKMKTHFIDEKQLNKWIKELSEQDKVFKFEKSDKNDAPSLNAEIVESIIIRDAKATGVEPNAWLVYSAFNELIHGKLKKSFVDQKALDTRVFNSVSELVGAY